jgi:hypothetical protein
MATLIAAGGALANGQGNQFNTPGNILISDQFNNRVIEVNPDNHNVVWRFGSGSSKAGSHAVVALPLGANPPARTDAPTIA